MPDPLKPDEKMNPDELAQLAREFGVTPGKSRHGETAMRWTPQDDTEFREDTKPDDGYIGTLHGHFCVFNRWTEIDSFFEGRFLEQIAPGACKKTFEENRKGMRCLFQHGRDPQVGMKPLGPIRELEEDSTGGRYEVPMLDTSYNRDLVPILRADQLGASFRFQVLQEEVNTRPERSDHNPDGIEERTITEMKIREFGPVTFPAYEDATAGVRSLNDWWLDLDLELFARAHPGAYPKRLAELLLNLRTASDNGTEIRTPSAEPEERGTAPSTDKPAADDKLHSTYLTGAARTSLKSRTLEEPEWKL